MRVGASTFAFQRNTVATRFIRFIGSKTSHICFLSALLRLEDVFSVALHLDCLRKLVFGIEPAPVGVVSILLAQRTRDDGLGHISFCRSCTVEPVCHGEQHRQ